MWLKLTVPPSQHHHHHHCPLLPPALPEPGGIRGWGGWELFGEHGSSVPRAQRLQRGCGAAREERAGHAGAAGASRSPCAGGRRWPRTLAGITAFQPCLQHPFAAGPAAAGSAGEKQAWRRCDRTGRWEDGDYSRCLYTNDITRVLYTFVLVSEGPGGSAGPEGEGRW